MRWKFVVSGNNSPESNLNFNNLIPMKLSHIATASMLWISGITSWQPVVSDVFLKRPSSMDTSANYNGAISIRWGLEGSKVSPGFQKTGKLKISTTSQVDQLLQGTFWPDVKREWGAVTFLMAIDNDKGELKGYIGKYRTQNIEWYTPRSSSLGFSYGRKFK